MRSCADSVRQGAAAALLAVAGLPGAAAAHGAALAAGLVPAVSVQALYDTGEPMAGAQVSVFAPDAPTTPWLRGTTDEAGRFVFVPDGRAGRWTVQARQAGHGAVVHIDPAEPAAGPSRVVGAPAQAAASIVPLTADRGVPGTGLQRAVMALCVIWGLVGTALFFRRRSA
jgi:nickel transport protein